MSSKKQIKLISTFIVIALSLFGIIFSNSSSKFASPFASSPSLISPTSAVETQQDVEGSSTSDLPILSPSSDVISNDDTPASSEGQQGYRVVKVVDGDTIDVDIDGETSRLRLIGIDTPETVDPRKPVQCFGIAASNKAKELLSNRFVTLEADESQGNKDKYGRLLRYVFLPDGTNYGLFMISEGYAHEYTYNLPYKYQAEFKQAEIDAVNGNKGLWSPDTCSGNK